MPADDAHKNPKKRCHNCGLPCSGMFCCDWCLSTYLARRDAHQAVRQRRTRSQSNKCSPPGSDQAAAGDQSENCGPDRPRFPPAR
jgi:hypothetical protein